MSVNPKLLATFLLSQCLGSTAAFNSGGFLGPPSVRGNGASAAATSKSTSPLTLMFHEEGGFRSSRLHMSKGNKAIQSKDDDILHLINGHSEVDEKELEDVILEHGGEKMEFELEEEKARSEELQRDEAFMQQAIQMASSGGGERGSHGPFPHPICGAILIAKDGRVLGKGRSSYAGHAIEFSFQEAGINATPLREWCVAWPQDAKFRKDISESTLYVVSHSC